MAHAHHMCGPLLPEMLGVAWTREHEGVGREPHTRHNQRLNSTLSAQDGLIGIQSPLVANWLLRNDSFCIMHD